MKNNHWSYWLYLPIILFIMFGAAKIFALHRVNNSLQGSLHTNQAYLSSLQKSQRQTTLSNYNINASHYGYNLYQRLPDLDEQIKRTLLPVYTKVSDQKSFDTIAPKVKKASPGSLATTALQNAKPQSMQGQSKSLSPYNKIKNIKVDNKYSNYEQGNIVILSDVTYTNPGQTVSGGKSIKLPGSVEHNYYLSSYNFNDQHLDIISTTHSEAKGDE